MALAGTNLQADPTDPRQAQVLGITPPVQPVAAPTGIAPAPSAAAATAGIAPPPAPTQDLPALQDAGVASRLAHLTSEDSPLMKQARTSGLQAANARGLLNSSIGVGASEDARCRAALPIAQQEASQAQQSNTQRYDLARQWRGSPRRPGSSSRRARRATNIRRAQQQGYAFQAQQQQNQNQFQKDMLAVQQGHEVNMANLSRRCSRSCSRRRTTSRFSAWASTCRTSSACSRAAAERAQPDQGAGRRPAPAPDQSVPRGAEGADAHPQRAELGRNGERLGQPVPGRSPASRRAHGERQHASRRARRLRAADHGADRPDPRLYLEGARLRAGTTGNDGTPAPERRQPERPCDSAESPSVAPLPAAASLPILSELSTAMRLANELAPYDPPRDLRRRADAHRADPKQHARSKYAGRCAFPSLRSCIW
jgi:hypothetical protein